ncbi:histidine kinase [Dethiosulfovibrio peptidovorans DSM 11002]|uniref:Histidine kinase n=1 Tax=Dethiosulfovibrio peptidovorans DSM 11002 TaxID=469381 RepID=D2Z822_9BACT|nr:sensor histidine kinase [Dethiosulfovibrio peptidovorans]EFC91619.1 histidine kinase [Dethiosulfovibrio peptidovorans DSM 11002]
MDENSNNRIDRIFTDVTGILSEGMDELTQIRMEEYEAYLAFRKEFGSVQRQVEEVVDACENCGRECRKARKELVVAAKGNLEKDEKEVYFRVEHLMKLHGSLEERERSLRAMRDHLAREIRHKEVMLKRTEDLGSRFRMAMEIIDSGKKVETPEQHGVLAAAIAMAERESAHMARDLHDGPAQKFADAVMTSELVERYISEGAYEDAIKEISSLKDAIFESDRDVRAVLHQLTPPGLDQGLDVAIGRLTERLSDRHGVEIDVSVEGMGWKIPLYMRANIFKILYQGMINAIRNGKASNISLRISVGEEYLRAQLSDDGIGFDVEAARLEADRRGSYGLRSMNERAELAGGSLSIESTPGRGTVVRLTIPLKGGEDL